MNRVKEGEFGQSLESEHAFNIIVIISYTLWSSFLVRYLRRQGLHIKIQYVSTYGALLFPVTFPLPFVSLSISSWWWRRKRRMREKGRKGKRNSGNHPSIQFYTNYFRINSLNWWYSMLKYTQTASENKWMYLALLKQLLSVKYTLHLIWWNETLWDGNYYSYFVHQEIEA